MAPHLDTVSLVWRFAREFFRATRKLDLPQRLSMILCAGAPVERNVSIWWNEHQVPFIESESDRDLAVALGIIHAHLRLAQMEVMRRIARGRVSELVGRRGLAVDRMVRTFDPCRAVPQILSGMPQSTLDWIEGFATGINHVLDNSRAPREFALLGIGQEHWTAADIVALGRLISADVNWLVWMRIFRFRLRPDWPRLWRDFCTADTLSMGAAERNGVADLLVASAIRSGSNSCALAGFRSETGSALIASDPHLSITLPNCWLVAGFKSPSHHAVGMMVPGIPFVGIGRNPWIGWGGTSLHAASSDLVAVPPETQLSVREERIKVLGESDTVLQVQESPWGPVVSDLPAFAGAGTVALRWTGHLPSDEFTAMLRVGTARSWKEFREALSGYSVPGLEMVFASACGDIGYATAVTLPKRSDSVPADILSSPGNGWENPCGADTLPSVFNPKAGYIASANARVSDSNPVIGYHFSPPIRVKRLAHLLGGSAKLSLQEFMEFQSDVHCAEAVRERDMIRDWLTHPGDQPVRDLLNNWNGNYDADSRAALALEIIFVSLARDLVPGSLREALEASWGSRTLIRRAIANAPAATLNEALARAVKIAAQAVNTDDWGTRHRLVLQHPLANLPGFGRRYRVYDLPASGSSETLMKTAHGLTADRHRASYGSVSRHVSDLSNPDENYFALLGGQDGWIGSTTFADQVQLWCDRKYMRIPLLPETVRNTFPHRTVLVART